MASIPHTVLTSDKVGSTQEISGKVFFSKDGLDQPCDITLVVRDGEFKAHRKVLSEASPFFEKLLNSDMKECKEGVVRLEIFTDSLMRSTLEFIYTGNVQILDEDEARDLIMLADYLLLPNLKILAAQVLFKKCNISNCISIFRFADEYHCEELVSKTKTFTLSNFTTIFTHNRENVLRMSIKELTMLISRDELHVSTEEDVFNIILAWIHHAKRKRQNYFAELFRHVRLLHISRDFLSNDVVTNEFVKGNKGCLDLVHKAIGTLDSKNFDNLPDNLHYTPRKVFESSVLITYSQKYLMCFFPRENSWYTLGDERPSESRASRIFSCNSKLYSTRIGSVEYPQDICRLHMSCYDPYSNAWTSLPVSEGNTCLWRIFVNNKDEMFALFLERCGWDHYRGWRIRNGRRHSKRLFGRRCAKEGTEEKHVSFIMRYKPELHKWKEVTSFNHLDLRQHFTIVAHNNFIYFIGGIEWHGRECEFLNDVDRYDLNKDQWEKLTGLQIARKRASGAAGNRKVIISGGVKRGAQVNQCEIYDEETNEWHFIEGFNEGSYPNRIINFVTIDDEVYALIESVITKIQTVKHYDFERNRWSPNKLLTRMSSVLNVCSMRMFKGWLDNSKLKSFVSVTTQDTPRCSTLIEHSLAS